MHLILDLEEYYSTFDVREAKVGTSFIATRPINSFTLRHNPKCPRDFIAGEIAIARRTGRN